MVLLVTWAEHRSQLADILHLKPAIAFIAVLGSFDVDPLILLPPPSSPFLLLLPVLARNVKRGTVVGDRGIDRIVRKEIGRIRQSGAHDVHPMGGSGETKRHRWFIGAESTH